MDSVNKLINKQKQNIIDEFVDGLIGEGKTIITLKELKEFYDTIEKQKKQIKRLREKNKLLREENSRLFLDQDITNTLYNEASSEYNSLKYDYKILKNKENFFISKPPFASSDGFSRKFVPKAVDIWGKRSQHRRQR